MTPGQIGVRLRAIAVAAAVIAAGALVPAGAPASAAPADWPGFLYNKGHSSLNPAATAITPANAGGVHQVWTFVPTKTGTQPPARILGSPVVVRGIVYIASFSGTLWALDETTGQVVWSAPIGFTPQGACPSKAGPTSTPVVVPDPSRGNALTVYVAGGDGALYAINAATGAQVWRSAIAATNTAPAEFLYSAPLLRAGNLYVGVATNCEPPLAPGRLVEVTQSGGTPVHTYAATPGGVGGAGIWITPATDSTSIWVTTGNADEQGVDPPGDSYSIVRLAANNLVKQDIWTVQPSLSGTDFDFGSSPTLFTATISGTATEMVGACNKNGNFYALAAQNLAAGPVWSHTIGTHKAGGPTCLASAIWDSSNSRLILASNKTSIAGVSYGGSLRAVDPATGAYLWQRGLNPGPIEGSPSENGAGVIAAATADGSGGINQLYLVNAATGAILKSFALPSLEFSQPVFANGFLFSAPLTGGITEYAP